MKKAEILTLSHEEVIHQLLQVTTRLVKEAYTRNGETKRTLKEEEWLLEETAKRFNLDLDVLLSMINKV